MAQQGCRRIRPMNQSQFTMIDRIGRADQRKRLPDIRNAFSIRFSSIFGRKLYRTSILIFTDVIAIALAWIIARFFNQFYSPLPKSLLWWTWFGLPSLFWIMVSGIIFLFYYYGLYSSASQSRDYMKAGKLVSGIYLGFLVVGYFYDPKLDLPRSLFFTAWLSSIFFIIFARLTASLIIKRTDETQKTRKVFIIATAIRIKKISEIVKHRSQCEVVGAAISNTANSIATSHSIVRSKAEEVLVEDIPHTELASELYWRLRSLDIPMRLLPSSREMLYRKGVPEVFSGLPTLKIETSSYQLLDYQAKRWLDFVLSAGGIFLLAPVFLAISAAIKATDPGPVFFKQERIGLHNRVFQVWKFRTMINNAESFQKQLEHKANIQESVLFKIEEDPRITSVGQFLRRTSLDELPQLFNVLLGQMSLVGPRPLPLRDISLFRPWHHIRHQVLPGMTGLWQVSGRSDIKDFDDAARLDLHYIDNWSLNLDLEILLETIKIVCLGKGAY